jgi:hypothetical protein
MLLGLGTIRQSSERTADQTRKILPSTSTLKPPKTRMMMMMMMMRRRRRRRMDISL